MLWAAAKAAKPEIKREERIPIEATCFAVERVTAMENTDAGKMK
jgi:hypothetical protein